MRANQAIVMQSFMGSVCLDRPAEWRSERIVGGRAQVSKPASTLFVDGLNTQVRPAYWQLAVGIASIQAVMSARPSSSTVRVGSSGILISGSTELMRNTMMESAAEPGTMSYM